MNIFETKMLVIIADVLQKISNVSWKKKRIEYLSIPQNKTKEN
jgi:hypothetical protein